MLQGEIERRKKLWMTLAGSMIFALVGIGFVGVLFLQNRLAQLAAPRDPRFFIAAYIFGVLLLLSAILWSQVVIKPTRSSDDDVKLDATSRFQWNSLIGFAFVQGSALLSLFTLAARGIWTFYIMLAAALATALFFVLPAGMKYWSAAERLRRS
jgi:hypothetical protein